MSRAILEDELNSSYGACSTSDSSGINEHILECEGTPGVYWDLISDGEFNWDVPVFNITGDQVLTGDESRVGNEDIEGYRTYINTSAPTPQNGVTLYASNNKLYAKTTDGQTWQLAPIVLQP